MSHAPEWNGLKLPDDSELLRKEWFTYRIEDQWYDIELFEKSTGEYYAIGTPANKDKLIIYGSAAVSTAQDALHQTIQKINRDHFKEEILSIGEDVRDGRNPGSDGC